MEEGRMSKEKYRIEFYSRYETRLYTSFEELIKEKQRQIAISKMTHE